LGDWAAAGSGRGGWLVAADLLIFIRMLIFLTADFFGFATKIFLYTPITTQPICPLFKVRIIILRRYVGT
jgi:hypothetical protein